MTEGRGRNVFALTEGQLLSPEKGVLEGITRRTVLELSEKLNVETRLGLVPRLGPGICSVCWPSERKFFYSSIVKVLL